MTWCYCKEILRPGGSRLLLVTHRLARTSAAALALLAASAVGWALVGGSGWAALAIFGGFIELVALGQWVRVAAQCVDAPWLRALDTARAYLADEEPARRDAVGAGKPA